MCLACFKLSLTLKIYSPVGHYIIFKVETEVIAPPPLSKKTDIRRFVRKGKEQYYHIVNSKLQSSDKDFEQTKTHVCQKLKEKETHRIITEQFKSKLQTLCSNTFHMSKTERRSE